MTRVAAIDCGTNSIRLLIADIAGGRSDEIVREMRVVRLGQGVDATGRLDPEAIERTVEATRAYASLIHSHGVEQVRFCATSAARDAENAAEFAAAIEEIVGVRPQVLTGEQEAQASFVGATRGLDVVESLVIDIGGGSTELVLGTGDQVLWSTSLDIGSVRMTERFLHSDPPEPAEVDACAEFLRDVMAEAVIGLPDVASVIGVAGTITTVAAHVLGLASYDRKAVHSARISIDDIHLGCLSLLAMTVAERRALPFMHPGRADVIGAGAMVLDAVLHALPLVTRELIVSERDILDGIAFGVGL